MATCSAAPLLLSRLPVGLAKQTINTQGHAVGAAGVISFGPDSDGDYKITFDDDGKETGYVKRNVFTLEDEAVRMMGPGCIRSMAKHPAVVQVMRQSNCTDNLQVNAVAESIADREVQRLRSAPDWRGAAVLPTSRDASEGGW